MAADSPSPASAIPPLLPPSPTPSPTPSAQLSMNAAAALSTSPSPPPPWTLRPDSTGGSTGRNSPQAAHFSISRTNSRRSTSRTSNAPLPPSSSSAAAATTTFGRGRRGTRGSRASFSSRGRGRRRGAAGGQLGGAVAAASSTARGLWRSAQASGRHALGLYLRLSPGYRLVAAAAGAASLVVGVLALVYSHRVFAALGPVARGWHELRGGWVLVWLLVFVTGFPPIIGYSTACTLAGLVYDFPGGWPIAASANVAGSLAAFVASRTVLSRYVDRLVGHDHRFVALGHVLRHDGIWVLAAVRFCPLPYSLSNGFLATIPSITPLSFALSTAIASPKLLVHVFVGSRLARLAEEGDSMSAGDKALNYLSMVVFGLVGVGVGFFIFRRTMARAAEIAALEEAAQEEGRAGTGPGRPSAHRPPGVYADAAGADDLDADDYDDNAPLMDPEDADVAALMDDDDISLWTADPDDHFADGDGGAAYNNDAAGGNKAYHDDSDGEQSGPRASTGKR